MAKKKSARPDETPKPRGPSGPSPEPSPPAPEPLPPSTEAAVPARARPKKAKPNPQPKAPKAPKAAKPRKPNLDLMLRREQAVVLANQGADALDARRRASLARQALALDPNCAQAYYLLADDARTRKDALVLYRQAVDAAARTLGPELFVKGMGHFWGLVETRPYMRARLALAEAVWSSGHRTEAVDHLEEMLRLNPGDNQGLRYILASWLLSLDRLEELGRLLDQFVEDSATWAFTRTLAEFRRSGNSAKAQKFLAAARKTNKHVVDYLMGQRMLPPDQPSSYSPGDENDAIIYVAFHLSAWKSTPGAIAWIRTKVKAPRKKTAKPAGPIGPSQGSVERLGQLPSELDTWQADFRQFTRRIEIAGERVRPWMILVSSRTRELVLAHALTDAPPSPSALWDLVAGAMERPAAGDPHRPTEIQIRPGFTWEPLARHFKSIGVAIAPSDVLDQIDFLFEDLTRHMAGSEPTGLLDMPGVNAQQVGRFFEAAANFYRRAPWRSLGYEAVIRIECDRYESGPWFAVIMGQSGLTLGLALYEDLALLRKMWSGKLSDDEGARRTVALTVTYDDEASLPEVDLEAIQTHGWPIADPEGYPSIFRKERGLSMRPPLSWEIDLMDACLRVLPDFVGRRSPDDPTRELVPVVGPSGTLELGLSWIEEPI